MFPVGSPFRLRVSHHLGRATFPAPASSNAACGFPHCALLFASPQGLWGLLERLSALLVVFPRETSSCARDVSEETRRSALRTPPARAGARPVRVGGDCPRGPPGRARLRQFADCRHLTAPIRARQSVLRGRAASSGKGLGRRSDRRASGPSGRTMTSVITSPILDALRKPAASSLATSSANWKFRGLYVHVRARNRQGFGWARWSRGWLYQTLKLFNGYRVVRPRRGVKR